jgi:hypothetical protein
MTAFRIRNAAEVFVNREEGGALLHVVTALSNENQSGEQSAEAKRLLIGDVAEQVANFGLDGFVIDWANHMTPRFEP